MEKRGAGTARAEPAQAGGNADATAGTDMAARLHDVTRSAPIGIRCLACGSDDLDASVHPRGDEPVRCRPCGAWHTYLDLEVAAVEAVRRDRSQRGSA